ncbi:MAG TPA: hypothetical protein DER01_14595 [Phycisphaerales bacterium]|nr:hypothetical protein [Phycisphaerales bacterium]|tara:strand:+ start:54110 stop:55888 length:1779 start_codon:yes stop_codon:yes gene_type:complete
MSIEIVTIVVYLLLMLVIGIVVQRMNKNVSDYFRNGCRGQWWLVGASAFMTMFSAWTFTGAAGVAFTAGWSAMIIFVANFIGFMLNFLFLAPWFRQLRATTAPEVLLARFGFTTQQFYAWASIPTGLFYASLHLYGLSIFSSSVFGLPINAVIIGVGLVVLVYATTGGSWAVMSSDFLQFLILMPMTLLLAFLSLKACGGVDGFFELVKQKQLTTEFQMINSPQQFGGAKFSLFWAIAISLQLILGANTLNSAPRYFAVKDGREARKAALLAGIMMLLGSVIWFIPPMVGRLLFEQEINAVDITTPAEAAYAITSMKLLPVGMTGLMVVAMFSATMSSMDSGLNRNAAIFTKDIYPAWCRFRGTKPLDDKALLRLGQAYSLVMGVVIICLASYFANVTTDGIFVIMNNIGALLGLPLATPTLLAIFIKRVPWWSAIFSACCALCVSAYSLSVEVPMLFHVKVFTILGVGWTAFLLTIPFWSTSTQAYRDQVSAFFKRMYTPVDFEKEIGQANDSSQLRIVGMFAIIIGLLIHLLLFVPNSLADRMGISFVGLTLLGIGLLMVWAGGRINRRNAQTISRASNDSDEASDSSHA